MKDGEKQWRYESLEEIAEEFTRPEIRIISFDVFDTLLVRPLERPGDLYELLDRDFGMLSEAQISFGKLRLEAEAVLYRRILRGEILREDICLEEIYQVLEKEFGIEGSVVHRMMEREWDLEKRLCQVRQSGAWLFHQALASGKPVIIVSDMYLSKKQVTALLEQKGYEGMSAVFVSSEEGKRKRTGTLYDVVAEKMGASPGEILHIGDQEEADCRMAIQKGFQAAWLPGVLQCYDAHGCGHQAEKICTDLTDWEAARNSVGIGIFRAMAAEKYFDDPFRPFEAASDYNGDPYFVGYAALGVELLALMRWLEDNICRDQVRNMVFLARDGYLPRKAYEMYRAYRPGLPPSGYLRVSRMSVLPAMIRMPEDLFDLPVDVCYQTPRKLLRLLRFCTVSGADGEEVAGLPMDETLTKDTFQQFIREFIRTRYDRRRHQQAVARISAYLQKNEAVPLAEDTAIFDMGYSGRIAAAVSYAAGVCPKVYYFHTDARGHFRYEKRSGLKLRTFFDFNPYMESSLREYSYLEPEASCVAYTEDLKPVYDIGPAEGYEKTVTAMQQGALDFVRDYLKFFGEYLAETGFRCHDGAMPFEAFLRYCSVYDRKMYEEVFIDDELWGGRRDINLRELMEIRLGKLPEYAKEKKHE